MKCSERRDSILLYAAGQLDVGERAAVCEHLATGCPICASALIEAQQVVGTLAASVDEVAPPAGAFGRLLARVQAMPVAESTSPSAPPIADRGPFPRLAGETGAKVARRSPRRTAAVILTTAAACIALTASALLFWTRDARTFWQSDDLMTVRLTSPTQPNATAQLWWDRENERGRIVVASAVRPAAGREYELWIIPPGGAPKRSLTFNVDDAGRGSVVVPIPADTAPGATFAITDEPLGGTDAPTGQIHFAGSATPKT